MSEAGKDASARPETEGDSLPVRALSRVAPQSVQIAKDHALLGRSIWCGVVFALAVVITSVNCLPPASVGYCVTTKVLVSRQRLESLEQELKKSTPSNAEATLLSVNVLDDTQKNHDQRSVESKDSQILLEVSSLWPNRTTNSRFQHWLADVSKVDERVLTQIDSARVRRFARWEVQSRQQYLDQYRQSRIAQRDSNSAVDAQSFANDASSTLPSNVSLSTSADKPRVKFATLGEKKVVASMASATHSVPESGATANLPHNAISPMSSDFSAPDDIEKKLLEELDQAKKMEVDAAAEVATEAVKAAGSLTLSNIPEVHAVPDRMPRNLVLSMLVLALASGAVGGWANHRAQSGGTFRAVDVGTNMQLLGLPILGHIRIAATEATALEAVVTNRIRNLRRLAVQQCLAFSEFILFFWCMAIAIRLVLDPLWRGLIMENPLSALARLFIGLP